jgi:putative hydrolase of the HAD superfamily
MTLLTNNRGAIIFDGDDTLWETQMFYDQAKERFYDLMKAQGFSRDAARQKFSTVSISNVENYGLSRNRFLVSMREVYEYFCYLYSRPVNSIVLTEIDEICFIMFNIKPRLIEGADQLLCQLRFTYKLFLYTSGEIEVQEKKIETLAISKYFDDIFIVNRKNHTELMKIVNSQRLNIDKTWMIGNSVRSDINPALRMGLRCIWIARGSWEYDDEPLLDGRIWKIFKLDKILCILSEVDNLGLNERLVS